MSYAGRFGRIGGKIQQSYKAAHSKHGMLSKSVSSMKASWNPLSSAQNNATVLKTLERSNCTAQLSSKRLGGQKNSGAYLMANFSHVSNTLGGLNVNSPIQLNIDVISNLATEPSGLMEDDVNEDDDDRM